jgi:hypothetical protein
MEKKYMGSKNRGIYFCRSGYFPK